MDNTELIPKDSVCFSCLCKNGEFPLQTYDFKNSSLINIFQVDRIRLCYLCMRIAHHADVFIKNVQNNQTSFGSFYFIKNTTIEVLKSSLKPSINLSQIKHEHIQLDGNDSSVDKLIVVYNSKNNNERVVKVECETKCEDDDYNIDDDSRCGEIGDDDRKVEFSGSENIIKEEEIEIPFNLKEKLKTNETKIKCLDKSTENNKLKKQKKKEQTKANCKRVVLRKLDQKPRFVQSYTNSNYKCDNCIKGFRHKKRFEWHMKKHSQSNGDFECDICKQRMPTVHQLNSHKKHHEKQQTPSHENKFECEFCKERFAFKEYLRFHVHSKHPMKKFPDKPAQKHVCNECGETFDLRAQLNKHTEIHTHPQGHYCVECNKKFKTNSRLQQHFKTVKVHISQDDLRYPCSHCDMRFVTKSYLASHVNNIHLKISRFYCDKCGKEFKFKCKLKDHLMKHEGYVPPRKFVCDICFKGFVYKRTLDDHLRIHTGIKPFRCTECPAKFAHYGSLYNHRKCVHKSLCKPKEENKDKQEIKIEKKDFYPTTQKEGKHPMKKFPDKPAQKHVCNECGETFDLRAQLNKHTEIHTHPQGHYCVECNKKFKTNSRLQHHFKTVKVHISQDDLRYPCSHCDMRFVTKSYLASHVNNIHLKISRFYCDKCGKEFKFKCKLKDHLMKHEGYVPPRKFVCDICFKGFVYKRTLDDHLRTHTGAKPFRCTECPAEFAQYGSLYNHRKSVHKSLYKPKEENKDKQEIKIEKKRKKKKVIVEKLP